MQCLKSSGICRCIAHQHHQPLKAMSEMICELQMHCELGVVCICLWWVKCVCIVWYVLSTTGQHNISNLNIRGWYMCTNISGRMPSAIRRCAPPMSVIHGSPISQGLAVSRNAVFDSFFYLHMYPAFMQHNRPLNFMSGIICESQTHSALGLNDMYFWKVMYICMSW